MSILTLPRELQLHILGLLPLPGLLRLSETCHRLKDLARDPSLWKELTLTYNMIKNNTKACREHVGRCSSLKELFICGQEGFTRSDITISVVLNNLKDLRILKISSFHAKFKDLVALFSSLKKLEEVKIRKCLINNEDLVIESLVVNNPNIHHLDIYRDSLVTRLTSRSLDSIAENCPLLTHINIGNRNVMTNDGLIKLVSKCSKLKYANFEKTQIEDNTLEMLARDCPDLEHLDISYCYAITLQGVEAFLDKVAGAKLKSLNIRECGFLTKGACPKKKTTKL